MVGQDVVVEFYVVVEGDGGWLEVYGGVMFGGGFQFGEWGYGCVVVEFLLVVGVVLEYVYQQFL